MLRAIWGPETHRCSSHTTATCKSAGRHPAISQARKQAQRREAAPTSLAWEDSREPIALQEIQPVHPKGDQCWVFIGRTDAEAETPVLWPPHAKSWLIGKDSDAGRDWGQEEKGATGDEMAGWHHQLDGREFEWTPGVGDGQGGLVCCDSWGRKESDTTERLNWTELVSKLDLTAAHTHTHPHQFRQVTDLEGRLVRSSQVPEWICDPKTRCSCRLLTAPGLRMAGRGTGPSFRHQISAPTRCDFQRPPALRSLWSSAAVLSKGSLRPAASLHLGLH